ncbi:hypothetical protein KBC86_02895 [Candidatus Gracilibacteria bacterium]|nr:hypothetical protein [Candidatus Gracilibacteria bacterium]
MPPTKSSRKKVVKTERSWLYRHFGSVVFSTLIFSTVAYAIAWPTVPGEAGYPVEGSFWKIFEKILVDTGATNDGTVKKSESLGKKIGRTAIVTDTNGNIGVGTGTATGYTMSVSGQALFTDTVLGAPPTSSGHLATKGYVDGVVSAGGGGGGYNQCYRVATTTAAYPSCATGFNRVYGAYMDVTSPAGAAAPASINFENNVGGYWFSQFGHVYLYYNINGINVRIYDDQDVQVGTFQTNCTTGPMAAVFSQNLSTYQAYNVSGPINFTCNWHVPQEFGYAVCCK